MTKVAIIGLGRMGTYHARLVTAVPQVMLSAIAEINLPETLPSGIPHTHLTTDYKSIIKEIDAAIIATPTPSHYEIAHTLLTHGVHILIEKPIAQTVQEAHTLFALAQKNKCILHIGHVERYNMAFIEAHKHIDNPRYFHAVRSGPFNARVTHDSVIFDLMIHDIDLIMQLVTSPLKTFWCSGTDYVSKTTDIASATLVFENGIIATLTANRTAQRPQRTLLVEQENNQLFIDYQRQSLTITTPSDQKTIEPKAFYNPLKEEITTFIQAVITQLNYNDGSHDLTVLTTTVNLDAQCQAQHPFQQQHYEKTRSSNAP